MSRMSNIDLTIKEWFNNTLPYIIATLAVLVIALFTLSGCGYGERNGNVINKQYTPKRTIIQTAYNGKSFYTYPVFYPERYEIKIQKEEDGKLKTTWITITKEQYENTQIGDYWGG